MKKQKALKRLSKIEALISDLTERYSSSSHPIREALQVAKAAVARAKEAVSLKPSSGAGRTPLVELSDPPVSATPEPSNPKRKLSEAGKKAIVAATKKRWAAFHAAKETTQPPAPKKTIERVAGKKAAIKKAATKAKKRLTKIAVREVAVTKSVPAKTPKAPVKTPAKKSAPVTAQSKAASESAPPAIVTSEMDSR